jgi:hypothetical protein
MRCEQALTLDPLIPAAPPLARLYEMAGRHRTPPPPSNAPPPPRARPARRAILLRMSAAAAERGGASGESHRLREEADGAADDDDLPAPPTASEPVSRIRLLEDRLRRTRDPEAIGDLHRQIIELAGATGDNATLEHHAAALLEFDRSDLSAFLALRNHATSLHLAHPADLPQARRCGGRSARQPPGRSRPLRPPGRRSTTAAHAYEQALSAAPPTRRARGWPRSPT